MKDKIREAVLDDIPRIVEMGNTFVQEGPYKDIPINHDQVTGFANFLICFPQAKVLVAENDTGKVVGFIAFLVAPHFYTGEITAQELIWYVDKDARRSSIGLDLLFAAQNVARSLGAVKMQVAAAIPALGNAFERFGYKQLEVAYERTL